MKSCRNFAYILMFCIGSTALAQESYEDTFGGFIIDLYDGMKPVPKKNDAVLTLKNDSYSIILQTNQGELDVEKAYALCVENLIASGMSEMKQKVGHQKMLVNGNAARMGTYESKFKTNGVEVSLIGAAFSIVLEQNTVSIVSIMAPKVYKNSRSDFEKSMYSIRQLNQEMSGKTQVEDWDITLDVLKNSIREEEKNPEAISSGEPTAVSFGGVSLMLPAGWTEEPKSRSDADNVIGKLGNKSQAVNGIVLGLKGIIWNKKRANQVAVDVGKQLFPSGNLEKALEINLANKKKGTLYKHTGIAIAEGKEVPMASISLVQKVGKQFLIHFMTMPDGPTEDVEQDMIAIANSAK